MDKIITNIKDIIPNGLMAIFSALMVHVESTTSFMFALFLGFSFNILAGLRADKVHVRMWRLCNFNGNKFMNSLVELFLIVITTYFLKITADLMGEQERSVFLVKWLVWVALYYYVTNGLKNLTISYPNNRWFRFIYYLISFQFSEFAPDTIKKAWDKSDKSEMS